MRGLTDSFMFTNDQRLSVLAHWSAAMQKAGQDRFSARGFATTGRDPGRTLRTTAVGSGFSGADVYRVDDVDDFSRSEGRLSWALKAWPPTASAQQIRRIAGIVRAAAPHCDLLAPPLLHAGSNSSVNGPTTLAAYGRYWELARWISGTPLPANASRDSIALGGEAIARVHQAMNRDSQPVSFAGRAIDRSVPRCITDRITRIQCTTPLLERIARQMPNHHDLSRRLAVQLTTERHDDPTSEYHCRELATTLLQVAAWLARQWPVVTPQLLTRLRKHSERVDELASAWVLRDVRREHVLFTEDAKVEGILDYDAVGLDSPAADLARWAGDFAAAAPAVDAPVGSPEASPLPAAVAGYRRIRPFSQSEWELAQTLIEVNRVGSLANWLIWLIAENRRFTASVQLIQGRISHLIASDCRIC